MDLEKLIRSSQLNARQLKLVVRRGLKDGTYQATQAAVNAAMNKYPANMRGGLVLECEKHIYGYDEALWRHNQRVKGSL